MFAKRFLTLATMFLLLAIATSAVAAPKCEDIVDTGAAPSTEVPDSEAGFRRFLRSFVQYWKTNQGVWEFRHEATPFKKSARLSHELLSKILRMLSPIPFDFLKTPTERIFRKQWKKWAYEPTAEEWSLLEKYGARKFFEERREFLKSHKWWRRARKVLGRTTDGAMLISLVAIINEAYSSSRDVVTPRELLSNPVNALQEGQIQLLLERKGVFSEFAIRMGSKVFFVKDHELASMSVTEYFFYDDLHAEEGELRASSTRSIQAVNLMLTGLEYQGLANALSASLGHDVNFLKILDGILKTGFPGPMSVVNQSPAQVFAYFSIAFMAPPLLDKLRIGKMFYIVAEGSADVKKSIIKDAYYNMLESKAYIRLFPVLELLD